MSKWCHVLSADTPDIQSTWMHQPLHRDRRENSAESTVEGVNDAKINEKLDVNLLFNLVHSGNPRVL